MEKIPLIFCTLSYHSTKDPLRPSGTLDHNSWLLIFEISHHLYLLSCLREYWNHFKTPTLSFYSLTGTKLQQCMALTFMCCKSLRSQLQKRTCKSCNLNKLRSWGKCSLRLQMSHRKRSSCPKHSARLNSKYKNVMFTVSMLWNRRICGIKAGYCMHVQ